MRNIFFRAPALVALLSAPAVASAQEVPQMSIARDLLVSCQDADNDARDGFESELECIGFIHGFMAAIAATGDDAGLCIPTANRDDALRRAFVSWVHSSFRKHSKMPAGEALMAALQAKFRCD